MSGLSRRTLLRGAAATAATAAVGLTTGFSTRSGPDWDALRRHLTGALVLPADDAYPVAKQLQGLQFDTINPSAIAYCATPADVSTCVRFAQDNAIHTVPRGGGHSSAGFSTTTGLVVDLSRQNAVTVNTDTVTVGAGSQQVDALDVLAPHGLTLISGLCPTVGAAGYLLGGGLGWLTRSHGMGCDHMVSAEVVLADGRVVRASPTCEPDLFWALRGGGGGNFGIVTSFEVTPVRMGNLVDYTLIWPWDAAPALLTAWQEWVDYSPRELGAGLNIRLANAAPGAVPDVIVYGAWQGEQSALEAVLADLIGNVGTAPTSRSVVASTYRDSMMRRFGCADKTVEQCHRTGTNPAALLPRSPFHLERGRLFSGSIAPSGIEDILGWLDANRVAGHARAIHGVALGGKANEPARTVTAYVHRDTRFSLSFATDLPVPFPPDEDRETAEAWAQGGIDVLTPHSNGETYQNFIDAHLPDWRQSYYAENYAKLTRVKRTYDPNTFFHFPQAVGT